MEFTLESLFKLLDSQRFNPEGELIEGLNVIENHLYNHLPSAFTYNQALETGRRLKISTRTVSNYLNNYLEKHCLLKTTRGHYLKISPIQRNLPEETIARQEYLITLIRQTIDEEVLDEMISKLAPKQE